MTISGPPRSGNPGPDVGTRTFAPAEGTPHRRAHRSCCGGDEQATARLGRSRSANTDTRNPAATHSIGPMRSSFLVSTSSNGSLSSAHLIGFRSRLVLSKKCLVRTPLLPTGSGACVAGRSRVGALSLLTGRELEAHAGQWGAPCRPFTPSRPQHERDTPTRCPCPHQGTEAVQKSFRELYGQREPLPLLQCRLTELPTHGWIWKYAKNR